MSASDKSYEAVVRLGFSTDTADAQGLTIGPVLQGSLPSRNAIDAALDAFRGTFLQQPPAFSAKRIAGKRSHALARARARVVADARLMPSPFDRAEGDRPDLPDPHDLPDPPDLPAPASVTVHRLDLMGVEGDRVTLSLDCSAGFYVRSLAHDLGNRLGVGAHLATLRRTRTADFTLDQAIDLDSAERDPQRTAAAVIPLADMLPKLASVVLSAHGVQRAVNGCELTPGDTEKGFGIRDVGLVISGFVRLLDPGGELVGIARPAATPGLLHPSVVLR
jgi:tRNA pseudouridine55 synthase